ncbi:hypothetical protein RB195_001736 [Necator americanus]|uniref:Uncharacterized protein n=1 Tax=Necator americanus TaxID=51031 RepID=A0ABR1DFQ3_NECAM
MYRISESSRHAITIPFHKKFADLRNYRGISLLRVMYKIWSGLSWTGAFRADGVPGKFLRPLDDMNQRTAAAFRKILEIVLAPSGSREPGPSGCRDPDDTKTILADLEYAKDVVAFMES